jgi:hypothetical protein
VCEINQKITLTSSVILPINKSESSVPNNFPLCRKYLQEDNANLQTTLSLALFRIAALLRGVHSPFTFVFHATNVFSGSYDPWELLLQVSALIIF